MPLWRRWLLRSARGLDVNRLLARSRAGVLDAARRAATKSPAYRVLLAEHGLQPAQISAGLDIRRLPALTKDNTFGRFSLAELAGPLQPRDLADVLTSSGRGGRVFGVRLTTRQAHDRAWSDIDLGLQDAFDIDGQPTLIVNCLPMGVVFPSRAATVANVSVREDMACALLKNVAPAYAQTLVCTDPLFVNRLLDHAGSLGVDWKHLNASMILGEEMLAESQRTYIANRLGMDPDASGRRMVGSSYGVGELGLNLLFETRETIALRRALGRQPELARQLGALGAGAPMPSIFCFNPMRCHVEVLDPDADGVGELCITLLARDAVIPLPRYRTGDLASLMAPPLASGLCRAAGVAAPWLPMLAVHGRAADRLAGGLSAEAVKEAIYADPQLAAGLTGAFRLRRAASETAGSAPPDPAARHGLLLQTGGQGAPVGPAALRRLAERLRPVAGPGIDIALASGDDFPDRPLLDHERKFRYVDGG